MGYLNFERPTTLTRIGNYNSNLQDDMESFNFTAEKVREDKDCIDIAIYNKTPENYFLLVSHFPKLPGNPNLIVSITSESPETNEKIKSKLAKKLNVEFTPAPVCLSKLRDVLGKFVFEVNNKFNP
jgi:hypothetical protein